MRRCVYIARKFVCTYADICITNIYIFYYYYLFIYYYFSLVFLIIFVLYIGPYLFTKSDGSCIRYTSYCSTCFVDYGK